MAEGHPLQGHSCSAMRRMAAAVWSSASSHEISFHPGSASPFGRVRRQRPRQPVLVIDQFGSRSPLGQMAAQSGASDRVQACESASSRSRPGAAAGDAKTAVSLHLLDRRVSADMRKLPRGMDTACSRIVPTAIGPPNQYLAAAVRPTWQASF